MEAFKYATELLSQKKLLVGCAFPKREIKLPEDASPYKELFLFDFQEYINLSEQQQARKIKQIEESLAQIDQNIEHSSKIALFQKLDAIQNGNFQKLLNLFEREVQSESLIQMVGEFLIGFRALFQVDSFLQFKNFQKLLKNLKFDKIYSQEFNETLLFTLKLEKQQLLELLENLSNLVTYTKLMKDTIDHLDEEDCTLLGAAYQVFDFFNQVNQFLPREMRVEDENFKNDEILSKDEYTIEVLRLIKENYDRKKKKFPLKLKINIPEWFNFLHWEFIFTVAQKADLLRIETKIMQRFSLQHQLSDIFSLLQEGLHLELNLRREHILEDALN